MGFTGQSHVRQAIEFSVPRSIEGVASNLPVMNTSFPLCDSTRQVKLKPMEIE